VEIVCLYVYFVWSWLLDTQRAVVCVWIRVCALCTAINFNHGTSAEGTNKREVTILQHLFNIHIAKNITSEQAGKPSIHIFTFCSMGIVCVCNEAAATFFSSFLQRVCLRILWIVSVCSLRAWGELKLRERNKKIVGPTAKRHRDFVFSGSEYMWMCSVGAPHSHPFIFSRSFCCLPSSRTKSATVKRERERETYTYLGLWWTTGRRKWEQARKRREKISNYTSFLLM